MHVFVYVYVSVCLSTIACWRVLMWVWLVLYVSLFMLVFIYVCVCVCFYYFVNMRSFCYEIIFVCLFLVAIVCFSELVFFWYAFNWILMHFLSVHTYNCAFFEACFCRYLNLFLYLSLIPFYAYTSDDVLFNKWGCKLLCICIKVDIDLGTIIW